MAERSPKPRDIAVVVPTLNEERALPGCLDAIGRHPGVEVVVSDGGSLDATVEIARGRAGVRVVSGGGGRGPQLNRGAAVTTASELLFVHADCRLPDGWLPAVRRALCNPEVALVCFRLRTEPSDGRIGRLGRGLLRLNDLRSRGWGRPYGDQGLAIRRSEFAALGGFPAIPLMEDVAFVRDAARLGRIERLPLEITTTGRRFERQPLRTRVMTATFPWLFRLGVSPHRLVRWYRTVR
jgi:rSAM/selenodomain-associated transferase 2